ncbi:MAG TPA: HTTM domain-containing protein [Thermoanaerobaculia bacterium]|nr:HTTM domain-containing protein [Thermoanaerobaculia bacterium]
MPAPAETAHRGPAARLLHRLFAPVDAVSLAFFRIGFGLLMVLHTGSYLVDGKAYNLFHTTNLRFKYFGFAWVEPLPPAALEGVFWLLVLAAIGIALGLFYRLAATVFFVAYTYVFLLDAAYYNNHQYLICLLGLLMAVVPAHRELSLDARRLHAERHAPAWALWLLRFQIGLPYFFGGLAKINADWLLRGQPMALWLGEGDLAKVALLQQPWMPWLLSWGGFLLDLLAVPLLLWRRTRLATFLVLVAFHVTNSQLFNIGVFPWLMIWATLLFFPPDWPRRLRPAAAAAGRSQEGPIALPARAPGVAALLALWVALQLLLPYRYLLYPGPVDWTDEAHLFSWRMKLRDKRGEVRFVAIDPRSRKLIPLPGVAPRLLSDRQRRHMDHDPELMRQFAGHLAQQLAEKGYPGLEIHVITNLSFNGRPPQPIVDPKVDLASQPARLGPAPWIVPLASDGGPAVVSPAPAAPAGAIPAAAPTTP